MKGMKDMYQKTKTPPAPITIPGVKVNKTEKTKAETKLVLAYRSARGAISDV